ncbi:cell division transport system permease protein [Ekhidna lutea]|uniref:Cell division protein FtsX n=1 Tax=Ekhidna lutea TaxID=447679 RepID=A0A239L9R7_EKHLU|nr:permease-like cell division protein FtsX [Ekhidna lutea]SNT26439.1 cell division transport system permease protein [Ekhidna lutea]
MEEKKTRKKRKLGSYPFASVVFSITVALLVLGLFGWLLLHSSRLGTRIQESVEIQVYLNKNLSQSDITKIRTAITSKPYVLVKEEPQIRLITKEEAAKQFVEATGEDFKDFLGDNPLRDLFAVNLKGSYQSLDSLNLIKAEIEKFRGVFEVEYEESLIESINQNLTKIGFILLGIAIFALLVVIILINNTIKLALFSQRFLIRSMQLVGATSKFIQRPFLFRSMFYGLLAGILACGIIYGFTVYMNSIIEGLSELQDTKGFLMLFSLILIMGIIVGYFSSLRAIRKYLKMSLDELY